MPSVEITISAWWAVAAAAQAFWFFGVIRPIWTWLDRRQQDKYRKDWRAFQRWRDKWKPLYIGMSGPLIWGLWAHDAIHQWRTDRHNARMRGARSEEE